MATAGAAVIDGDGRVNEVERDATSLASPVLVEDIDGDGVAVDKVPEQVCVCVGKVSQRKDE